MFQRILRAVRRDGPVVFVARQLEKILRPLGISPMSFTSRAGFRENVRTLGLKAQFDVIAQENLWGSGESASGLGSEMAMTAVYRRELVGLIRTRGFTSLFDAPCGDFNWMPAVLAETRIDYLGADIAPSLIERNRKRFPDHQFIEFDITRDDFPAMDVWQCRDCMFHLSDGLIWEALANFARSRCSYALLTTYTGLLRNVDIEPGGWRYLDLTRPPFRLPRAEAMLRDYRRGRDFPRYLGLWRRETIAAALAKAKRA